MHHRSKMHRRRKTDDGSIDHRQRSNDGLDIELLREDTFLRDGLEIKALNKRDCKIRKNLATQKQKGKYYVLKQYIKGIPQE